MEFIKNNKHYIILSIGVIILIVFCYFYYISKNAQDISIINDEVSINLTTKIASDTIYVDVKGAVKKPGVYEFTEESKVIDAINKAGGLTSSAVTSNINLSKRLVNEMVIYIFTKKELTTTSKTTKIIEVSTTPSVCNCETIEINNCIEKEENTSANEESKTSNDKININTATKDELMSLNSIGESKALAIIEYRKNKLFEKIEDIMNVSGLGESIFNKIKDSITI